MPVGAKPIIVTTAGGVLIWSGIKGMTISATVRDLLTGRNPSQDAPTSVSGDYPSGNLKPPSGGSSGGALTGSGGTHLSMKQIYQVARSAGFSPTSAVIATAIAMAESGGRPNVRCHNCAGVPEDSRGLWQINVNAHPQYANVNLYDPAANAAAAFAVSSHGKNFNPWSTYTSGAYQKFMSAALGVASG